MNSRNVIRRPLLPSPPKWGRGEENSPPSTEDALLLDHHLRWLRFLLLPLSDDPVDCPGLRRSHLPENSRPRSGFLDRLLRRLVVGKTQTGGQVQPDLLVLGAV